MLTLEKLEEFGANVEDGLGRCMNNEAFYLRLVGMVISDDKLDRLGELIEANELDGAFETAHALKGMYGNLSLTPVYTPLCEMTEYLRKRTQMDYGPLLLEAKRQKKILTDLAGD